MVRMKDEASSSCIHGDSNARVRVFFIYRCLQPHEDKGGVRGFNEIELASTRTGHVERSQLSR